MASRPYTLDNRAASGERIATGARALEQIACVSFSAPRRLFNSDDTLKSANEWGIQTASVEEQYNSAKD